MRIKSLHIEWTNGDDAHGTFGNYFIHRLGPTSSILYVRWRARKLPKHVNFIPQNEINKYISRSEEIDRELIPNLDELWKKSPGYAEWERRQLLIKMERFARYPEKFYELFDEAKAKAIKNGLLTFEQVPAFDPTKAPKTKWLVEHLIPERQISLFFGEFGSFKSTLLLWLTKAISMHQDIFDRRTRRRQVLYLDYENPPDVIRDCCEDLKVELENNPRFKIWDRFRGEEIPKPDDPRLEAIVKSCVRKTGRGLVLIFDSFASLLPPGDGGETTGQNVPIYRALRKLCDLGATICVLDHSRKYLPDIIHGGGKEAAADVIHNLVLYENKTKPSNPIVKIESFLKRKAPKGFGSLSFQVISERDKNGNWHVQELALAKDPAQEQRRANIRLLKRLIRKNPTVGQKQLEEIASTNGLPMNQTSELFKSGIGKYWETDTGAHGKIVYTLI